jgi:GTP-binding protein
LHVRTENAEFWAAARTIEEIPRARGPEIALAGRSNVGKSTLINRLLRRKKLARTSSTPGCTRGLIFYRVGERMALVDLPGYGWARRSTEERATWKPLVEGYLGDRQALAGALLLVDVRRGPAEEERMLAAYLDTHDIPRVWVLTKCDKLGASELQRRLRELEPALAGTSIPVAAGSDAEIDELRKWIESRVAEALHRR